MKKIWILLGIALLGAVLALGAVACGDDDEDSNDESPTATEAMADETPIADETPAADETPDAEASIAITAPLDGDTTSSPVTLEVTASGVEIAAAGDAVEGAGHFHAFVDQEPVAEGEAIPQETDGIFHFATGSLDLELEPGEHTVTVILGNNAHLRLAGVAPAVVTFTVE